MLNRVPLCRISVVVTIGWGMEVTADSRRMARAFMAKLSSRSARTTCKRYYLRLPNWIYLIFHLLYHFGLALWIGGAIALGACAAPELFKALPKQQAGAIFGPILGRFMRIRAVALLMIVIGAGAKFLIWERHAASPWIACRWAAIV